MVLILFGSSTRMSLAPSAGLLRWTFCNVDLSIKVRLICDSRCGMVSFQESETRAMESNSHLSSALFVGKRPTLCTQTAMLALETALSSRYRSSSLDSN